VGRIVLPLDQANRHLPKLSELRDSSYRSNRSNSSSLASWNHFPGIHGQLRTISVP
jgi:hypothetical protein